MCLIDGHCQKENDIHAQGDGTAWVGCPKVTDSAWTPLFGSSKCHLMYITSSYYFTSSIRNDSKL